MDHTLQCANDYDEGNMPATETKQHEAAVQRLVWWWGLSKVAASALTGATVVILALINYTKGTFPLTRGNAMAAIFVGVALWWNTSHMRDSEKREIEDVMRGDHGWTPKKALPRILRWMDEREAK